MPSPTLDIHRLIHYPETHGLSESTSGEAQILLESCSNQLPFGWLFLFGSRNIWEPGQMVKDRGGAAAQRDPAFTPMDVAQVRLHEASIALHEDPGLGPVCAPLQLLDRALRRAGERGQIRLESPPGAFGGGKDPTEKRRRFLERVAVAENIIYQLSLKNREQMERSLESLRDSCAFTPTGHPGRDRKEIQKAIKRVGGRFPESEGLVRLLVGWPPGGRTKTLFAAESPRLAAALKEQADAAPLETTASKPWWAFWK